MTFAEFTSSGDRPTFRALRAGSGLTQAEFAKTYGIPKRTVENWDAGASTPPPYVLDLLAYALHLQDQTPAR